MRAFRARRALPGGLAVLAALALAGPARADTVTDWNETAAAALQSPPSATPSGAGQGALSAVHLAMVHGAMYDAVNAITRAHEPFVSAPPAQPWYSPQAAIAAAARRVLLEGGLNPPAPFTPARVALIETAYANTLAGIPPGPARDGGIATGVAAADAMIASRAGDGRFPVPTFTWPTTGTLPGEWRPTGTASDAAAWLGDVRPFVLHDADLFRSRPPHALHTRAYAADFNEVKKVGSATATSTERNSDQTFAAQFWGAGNATATIASVLRSVGETQGAGLAENARLFALAYANAADAAIVTWRDKGRYLFWRPITAIREAASDGNAATAPDPSWASLVGSPPYPDHPSGLSGLGCSVADTLQDFYGRDAATFTGTTQSNVTRTFHSFSELCDDIVDARVWSGIHFRFADTEAAKLGRRVAHFGTRHAFGR